MLDRIGVGLDPHTPVAQLGIADRQIVEIARALTIGARVLMLDEPTAVLSSREIDVLFEVVRDAADERRRADADQPQARRDHARSPTE